MGATLLGPVAPFGQRCDQHLMVDRFLVRKVMHKARPLDADACSDVVERRSLEALIGKTNPGFGQDEISSAEV